MDKPDTDKESDEAPKKVSEGEFISRLDDVLLDLEVKDNKDKEENKDNNTITDTV